jgi:hypothetical protein
VLARQDVNVAGGKGGEGGGRQLMRGTAAGTIEIVDINAPR